MKPPPLNIGILAIGDELLIGQVTNSNAAFISRMCIQAGLPVTEQRVCADRAEAIRLQLEDLIQQCRVILMTGGLGPTKDDITKGVIADFVGSPLEFKEEAWVHVQELFHRLGRELTDEHRNQAMYPANAEILRNRLGTASGMWINMEGNILISLPGVPYEMESILVHEVIPRFEKLPGREIILQETICTAGVGETVIARQLAEIEDQLPEFARLAYLPAMGQVRLRYTCTGGDASTMRNWLDAIVIKTKKILGDIVYGGGTDTLVQSIGRLAREKQWMIAFAESCTGGYCSQMVTQHAGVSDWYAGSIVSYSNAIKSQVLHVPESMIRAHGAVSAEVAKSMLLGVLQVTGAQAGFSITGIAGPGGATEKKAVGLMYYCVGSADHHEVHEVKLGRDRLRNIESVSMLAMNRLRLWMMKSS